MYKANFVCHCERNAAIFPSRQGYYSNNKERLLRKLAMTDEVLLACSS